MIGIVDYGMGNMHSVCSAFQAIGQEIRLVHRPEDLDGVSRIVLPGVGSFGEAMHNLRERDLIDALATRVLQQGVPYLGICLGLQLLATTGYEHGEFAGLGWIPGTVERLPGTVDGRILRVPHIGWSVVDFVARDRSEPVPRNRHSFYFVHSYIFRPQDPEVTSGVCHYGVDFAAGVSWRNITAVQFHPEKSHHAGLQLLRHWCGRAGFAQ